MNRKQVLWSIFIGGTGLLLMYGTFFGIKALLSQRTPPIPFFMGFMGAIIVTIIYLMLVWRITQIKVRRVLYYKKSFWGPRLCRGYSYWRIGLGRGFLEIGGSCAGLYLPREDAEKGRLTVL